MHIQKAQGLQTCSWKKSLRDTTLQVPKDLSLCEKLVLKSWTNVLGPACLALPAEDRRKSSSWVTRAWGGSVCSISSALLAAPCSWYTQHLAGTSSLATGGRPGGPNSPWKGCLSPVPSFGPGRGYEPSAISVSVVSLPQPGKEDAGHNTQRQNRAFDDVKLNI